MYVRYDEFIADTLLNRILKRTCRKLLAICRSNKTSQLLSEALLELADVGDQQIWQHHFDSLIVDRSSERFRPLIEFSRIVLADETVSPAGGTTNSFSLLFPMEQVFEEFIGQFMRRQAGDLGISRQAIHIQATSRGKWLLKADGGTGKFRLRPDIVIDETTAHPRLIVDTKWKRLKADAVDTTNGVGQGDLYQLYAYAHRYASPLNVLVYPRVPGVTNKTYQLAGDPEGRLLRVAFVDLSQNLSLDHQALLNDLRSALAVPSRMSDLSVIARAGQRSAIGCSSAKTQQQATRSGLAARRHKRERHEIRMIALQFG